MTTPPPESLDRPKLSTPTLLTPSKTVQADSSLPTKKQRSIRAIGTPTRGELAVRRLKVSPSRLDQEPEITSLLRSSLKGGIAEAIGLLRHSKDPGVAIFLRRYDKVPQGDRAVIPIEAVAVKAGINSLTLLGAVMAAAKTKFGQQSALMAVSRHPDVLEKTIEFAQLPGGFADRRLIHESVGFLQGKKGMSVNIANFPGQSAPAQQPGGTQAALPEPAIEAEVIGNDFGSVFPSITDKLEEWGANRNKALSDKSE